MIGNDIVDLNLSAASWERPRFSNKVFTSQEQELILNCEHKHQMAWLLWSMKEAAYKIHVQQSRVRFFNPKRISCNLTSVSNGQVIIDNDLYFTSSTIEENYVHTIARKDNSTRPYFQIYESDSVENKHQSEFIKEKLMMFISEEMCLNIALLEIRKSTEGIPLLYYNSDQLDRSLSISHCGRFSAFTC